MTDLLEFAKKKRQECNEELAFLQFLESLQQEFPDLERSVDRWKNEKFSSALVNKQATGYHSCHSCGCCSDSPLYVFPYIEVTDYLGRKFKIYAKGIPFVVGERHPCGGELEYPGWEEKLRKAEIPEAIIEKVSHLFSRETDDEEGDI